MEATWRTEFLQSKSLMGVHRMRLFLLRMKWTNLSTQINHALFNLVYSICKNEKISEELPQRMWSFINSTGTSFCLQIRILFKLHKIQSVETFQRHLNFLQIPSSRSPTTLAHVHYLQLQTLRIRTTVRDLQNQPIRAQGIRISDQT